MVSGRIVLVDGGAGLLCLTQLGRADGALWISKWRPQCFLFMPFLQGEMVEQKPERFSVV